MNEIPSIKTELRKQLRATDSYDKDAKTVSVTDAANHLDDLYTKLRVEIKDQDLKHSDIVGKMQDTIDICNRDKDKTYTVTLLFSSSTIGGNNSNMLTTTVFAESEAEALGKVMYNNNGAIVQEQAAKGNSLRGHTIHKVHTADVEVDTYEWSFATCKDQN